MPSRRLPTKWRLQWGYSTATGRSRAIHVLNVEASGFYLLPRVVYDAPTYSRMKLLMQWRCGYMASTEKVLIDGIVHANYRIQLITRAEGEQLLRSGHGWKLCRQCHYDELMEAGIKARNADRLAVLATSPLVP